MKHVGLGCNTSPEKGIATNMKYGFLKSGTYCTLQGQTHNSWNNVYNTPRFTSFHTEPLKPCSVKTKDNVCVYQQVSTPWELVYIPQPVTPNCCSEHF